MTAQITEMQVEAQFTVPFTMVQNEVMDCMSFEKPVDKLAYIALLRFAFNKGQAFPSLPKLALMCSCTPNTVREALKRLGKMQLVIIEERLKENGTSNSNLYKLFELTAEMKANTINDKDLFSEAKKVFKGTKKKEKKSTLQNLHPTLQKLHPTLQNLEGEGAEFAPKEKELNNNHLNNKKMNNKNSDHNQSIYLSELNRMYEERNLPITILQKMKFKLDRLIDLSISPIDIEILFNDFTEHHLNDNAFASVLSDVLDSKTPIDNFKAYFKKSATNYKVNYTPAVTANTDDEEIPEFYYPKDRY